MAKVRKFKKTVIAVLGICLIMFAVFTGGGLTAYAESPVSSSDGTYSVPVNLDGLKMGADNFSSSATVEKSDENYYMTFGHSSSISDIDLVDFFIRRYVSDFANSSLGWFEKKSCI